jgi:DNA-binding transcriptional ArsR family regulator/uncharacterized protein YndB with AHSA1/START domain
MVAAPALDLVTPIVRSVASSLSRALDALTDPGRREVLEQLAAGPRTAAQLAIELAAPGPVLAEWLETLRGAGLVAEDCSHASTTYQVSSKGVEELRDYLERIANLPSAEVKGLPVNRHLAEIIQLDARFLVRRVVQMHCDQVRAFQLFTLGMGTWWPLGRRHFSEVSAVTVILEPGMGGRWFERGDDGSESPWGTVLVWEPPRRVVLNWRVGSDWRYDPGLRTEVEVSFIAEGLNSCEVQLEHRSLEQVGPQAARLQATFDAEDGWTELLQRFSEVG